MLTQDQIKAMFEYRPDGNLIRRVAVAGRGHCVGAVVGFKPKQVSRNNRYATTKVSGQHWTVHRLIYLYHHGWVPEQLDHINGNTLDNRIENLRPADQSSNMCNRKRFLNNKSGVKGVSWHSHQKKWFVYLDVNKKRKNIGYFDDLEFAELAANEARAKFHGAFANYL